MTAPPPPPPHGDVPRSSGLPPGKYDIFVIPEHSAGSGFLYLPSLQPNVNSFAAGFASALILVAVFQSMAPALRAWWETFNGLGNMSVLMLLVGVGFGAWALGRTQNDDPSSNRQQSSHNPSGGPGGFGSSSTGSTPNGNGSQKPPPPQPEKPRSSWQRSPPNNTSKPTSPKGSWEKAREETRKKEEERKAKEAEQKRREETAKRLAELRAKEAKERQERQEQEKERKENEKKEGAARAGSSYAFTGSGQKTSMWPNGKPPVPAQSGGSSPNKNPPSPGKRPPAPTAKTYLGTDDDAYSYRPYDQPKKQKHRRPSVSSWTGSEASWAQSQTTAHTTPPPSMRGPYTSKDPEKIVIQAVYLFMNQFAKTPASQLVSGVGSVTDGLILRITTEGLFIDDDIRGVPQREWDVKAWTLKLVEVWCPPHCLNSSSAAAASATQNNPSYGHKSAPHLLYKMATGRRNADRDGTAAKIMTGETADAYLTEMLRACKDCCRLGLCERTFKNTNMPSSSSSAEKHGSWKPKGLHVLRATVRDQDGKKYLFVLNETESWKLAFGLQRLRGGTQARQLGVSGMTASEAKTTLETLGWPA